MAKQSSWLPTWNGFLEWTAGRASTPNAAKNLTRYISPVQLARIKQDVRTWRDAMNEAENSWYPHRVKMQQIFLDTVLNGHVDACMTRRKNMTMLKKYRMVNKKTRIENPTTTALIRSQWFRRYMEYALDSKAYGYSLIYLDDIINDSLPGLSIVKRFNVSPDRLNVTQFVYALSGANFLEQPYAPWHVWIPTPTDVGVSKCGYGYLYKVAFYEIVARNVLTQNLDATQRYGMPFMKGRTNKSAESEERAIFEAALAEMGSNGWIMMDAAAGDDVELVESKSLGQGYKIYESLELRCEKKISKIILGHADALDSIPGKIGNDGAESPAQIAMRDTCTVDMLDLAELTNSIFLPKLMNLGMLFSPDEEFEWDNNEEDQEARDDEDKANLATANVYKMIKDAGGDPDWVYFTKRTGIPVVKSVVPVPLAPGFGGDKPGADNAPPGNKPPASKPGLTPNVKAKLEIMYADHKHKI